MAIATTTLDQISITTAVSGQTVNIGLLPQGAKHILLHSNFTYGSGGTTAKFYLQSSADCGNTWFDVVSLAHTTASLRRMISVDLEVEGAITTAADGALTDNTKLPGICGDRLRLKYTTVGTYAGNTNYKLSMVFR